MNETTMTSATAGIQARTGNWATRGAVAAGRGIAFAGLTLAAYGLWVVLLVGVALAPLRVGLLILPGTLRAMRRLASVVRRRSAGWCEVAIADPYRSEPDRRQGQPQNRWAPLGHLLTDPATWRDLQWTAVDMLVGWLFTLTSAGLILWGLFGVLMPAVWHPIVTAGGNNWYAFIHVTSAGTAWLSVALGIAFIALGLLSAPWLLRRYGALAHSMLAPA